ncbi:hypothetical protein [Pseudomonas sp.]|uniref:hypothetical protein n=1 Tax=Pseudomonas sp. TaxID=306 RepID=UPI0028A7DA21|nr:hypothetical protein [Pseudomonas sp.]
MTRAWLGGVVGAWVVTTGMAQAQDSERPALELENIVVQSDKLEQTRDQLPASLSVIDARTLQSAPLDSLEQLVRRTPVSPSSPSASPARSCPWCAV